MIELQLSHDIERYKELLPFSIYHSDRTKVLVLEDKHRNLIDNDCSFQQVEQSPYVSFYKGTFYINKADDITKMYLNIFNPKLKSFSLRSIEQLNNLLEQKIVDTDNSFKQLFLPLGADALVKDLYCSDKSFKFNKKMHNFKDILEVPLKNILKDPNKKIKQVRNVHADVLSVNLENDSRGKKRLSIDAQCESFETGKLDLNFSIYKNANCWHNSLDNKRINLLLDENNKVIEILPEGLKFKELTTYSPNKEAKKILGKMPVAMYRILLHEARLRAIIGE